MRKFCLILLWLPLWVFADNLSEPTFRVERTMTIFNDVMRQVDMNYVDTLNYEDLTETAINAMLRKIDPYTIYYPKDKDKDLKMMTTGKYGGIGSIISQREVADSTGKKVKHTFITTPYEGKPAQRNDVRAGDRILKVDGVSTDGKAVSEVSNMLRGVPGTRVTLTLERYGEKTPITRTFEREEVHMNAVDYATTMPYTDSLGTEHKAAYIAFGEFTTGSSQEFSNTLEKLVYGEGADAFIMDLRGNGGGIVDEAIKIVNLFVDRDIEVVSTKGKIQGSNRSYRTTVNPRYPKMKLIVLVDKNSASASEIVSGCLQDLGRATLIGQRTFGKGLVQNLRPIAYDGHLKVTTSKYYLPSGRCIQAIDYAERQKGNELKKDTAGGILPDIVMEDSAKVDITYTLYIKNMFFDYATRYHHDHPTIPSPQTFTLTDEEIEDFCTFLDEQKFTYETETSKFYKDMIEMAKNEDIDSITLASLQALEPKLKPSYHEAIQRNIDEVKEFLGGEIVERYYYQRGRAAYHIRFDKQVARALQEL